MNVDRNACADGHLLRPNCQIFRSFQGVDLDENVPGIAKMDEVFAFGGAQHVSLWICPFCLGRTR